MKKIIALLLVAVMCLSLAACSGEKEASNNNEPQTNESGSQQEMEQDINENETTEESDTSEEANTSEEGTEPDQPEILTAFDGKSPKIPSADFPNYLEVVEITAENWKDYFEVVYDEEWGSYDLSCKAPIWDMTNLTFELKVVKDESPINEKTITVEETGVLIPEYENNEGLEYTIDDFECVTAQGELIVGNIPEELWGTDGDTPVVYVGSNSGEQWMTIGSETSLGKFLD